MSAPPTSSAPRWDGRWLAAALVLVYALGLASAARRLGADRVLAFAGAPPMEAHFSDLYLIPAARFEFGRGGNPYLSDPADPWNRPFNYPRIWLWLFHYPWSAVPRLGWILAAAWLLAAFGSLGRLSPGQGLAAGLALCSPIVVLALERANSDLLIFILVAAGLVLLRRGRSRAGWAVVLAAALLKFYPIAAFAAWLSRGRRSALRGIGAALALLALWTLAQWADLGAIRRNTPSGGPAISYGAGVVLRAADLFGYGATGRWMNFERAAPAAIALFALAGAALALRGWRRGGAAPPDSTFFLAGAGLYLGTYLLGSNFVYREIFLLFCLPWLAGGGPWPRARRAALACLLISLCLHPAWGPMGRLTFIRLGANAALFLLLAWLGAAAARGAGQKSGPDPSPAASVPVPR